MDNKFKMPATETAKVVEEVAVVLTPTVEEAPQSTLTLAEKMPTERPRAFYVASQWHIVPAPGVDMIEAVNNQTGDRFDGSMVDFNDMLRGN